MSGFYSWSHTASTNASADNAVNWAEGMAPSAVNDSGRGMMASAAKWRDDISGALVTAGTATAYTVASYQGFDTLAHLDGMMIAFTPHATNGATVTLNVDGLGAKPLRGAPGVELRAATLIQGSPYVATYYNAAGEFILHGFHQLPEVIPVGGCIPYLGATVPNSNFAFPVGQDFSRAVYSKLFSLIGTIFGAGDGSTTFKGPDIRGRAFFGQDNMGGTNPAGRITVGGSGINGAVFGFSGGLEAVQLQRQHNAPHDHGGSTGNTQPSATSFISGVANIAGTSSYNAQGGDSTTAPSGQGAITITTIVGDHFHTILTDGNGVAHQNMPPCFICPVIMRII